MFPNTRSPKALALLLSTVASFLPAVFAREKVYINGTGIDGVTRELDVSRYPDLYTRDFADCMNGQSLFNVTRFDTAYYRDNLTVLFHLDGSTNIRQESLMLHIEVDVYGENRFNTIYEPCAGRIGTMCPAKAEVPIQAYAAINLTSDDAQGFPSIALGIPDLEGFARLRIFANSTQTEIGCIQAVLTNGQTFSQPRIVGPIVGGFICVAILASFATGIYGLQISHIRMHYTHSFSLLVIFETFQSMFFLGALSVNWPSLLPAWWSNFAWTAGMFASDNIVDSLASFAGITGNASQVGGAGSVTINNGGGLSRQIYGRSLVARTIVDVVPSLHTFARRDTYNASNPYDYNWAGKPRNPGLPLPGDFSGFAGTLSMVDVPERDAFIIGLIWFLVALGAVALFVSLAKFTLDALVKLKVLKTDGFDYFRSHWLGYLVSGLLRALFIAFFTMMTLATFQFSIHSAAGPTAVAAIIFVIFLALAGLAIYACFIRLRGGKYEIAADTLRLEQGKLFKVIPFVAATLDSTIGEEEQANKPRLFGTVPFFHIRFIHNDPDRVSTNQDSAYIKRFGWLSGRYRRERWWFFAAYLVYQFVRACFIGGGSQNPLAQVFGLFVFEIFALVAVMKLEPFEGARNTAIAVWLLSFAKIITTGISIAFLHTFGIGRIAATILGIVILVIQAFLALAVLVLVPVGMVSTWMSLSRNREEFPAPLDRLRIKYFEHMDARTGDMPVTAPPTTDAPTSFSVKEVRRHPKIDDREAFPSLPGSEGDTVPHRAQSLNSRSRANSASSRFSVNSLPRTGRVHRSSWSSKDIAEWDAEMNRGDQATIGRIRSSSLRIQSMSLQGIRPMTPTRESAEFPRMSMGGLTPEEKEAIAKDRIPEAGVAPRRRTVSFADQQPTSSGSNTSDTSTKVDESSLQKEEGEKLKIEVQEKPSSRPKVEETIHEKDEGTETEPETPQKAESEKHAVEETQPEPEGLGELETDAGSPDGQTAKDETKPGQ